jgi:hypothetical protein
MSLYPRNSGLMLDPEIMVGCLNFNGQSGLETWTHIKQGLTLCRDAISVKVGLKQLHPPVQKGKKKAVLHLGLEFSHERLKSQACTL